MKFTMAFVYSFSGYFNYILSSFFSTGTTQLNDESACESAGGLFKVPHHHFIVCTEKN